MRFEVVNIPQGQLILARLRRRNSLKPIPNPIDKIVGGKVRASRLLAGLSQQKLGAALGVSFQQVQKYESGANRISASRLQKIAEAVNVSLSSFFNVGISSEPTQPSKLDELNAICNEFLSTADGIRFLRAFQAVSDPKTRKSIVDLVVALAASGQSEPTETLRIRPAA
jgi:transcriptional regulator with XRE-family HTH domain